MPGKGNGAMTEDGLRIMHHLIIFGVLWYIISKCARLRCTSLTSCEDACEKYESLKFKDRA